MSAPAGSRTDLNADLGEGFGRWSLGDDGALLEIITSDNAGAVSAARSVARALGGRRVTLAGLMAPR